jgi:very-short-patch-repair endonuclease
MAAVLWAGTRAALSHLNAAVLWRMWRGAAGTIDVVVPQGRRNRPGLRAHESRNLDPRDVTRVRGIPVTTVARTLVDLGAVLHPHQLANVIHEAAFRGRFDLAATNGAMERAHGHHGLGVLAAALTLHAGGGAGTRSALEDRFLVLIRANGLPEPLVNTKVQAGERQIEVDFHWPDRRLCVEMDGPGHGRPRTREEDRLRDRRLEAAGQRVLRLTADAVRERPADAIARVRARLDG